ncbi:hypothetical protein B4U80_11933 [Leptotrombidium deliense]|uniref:Exonuclease domain-containing protein n=1 Tax=Leptotrombidium deliense TaxID=299467 RepID=A0A443S0U3_9ACAR|nr:hypothetical protein B4U80_11933 [Leptotrombidium deliense]
MCSLEETTAVKKVLLRKRGREIRKRRAPLPDWSTAEPGEGAEDNRAAKVAKVHPAPKPNWFDEYTKDEVVAIDCEFVRPIGSRIAELATVAIVGGDKETIYKGMVKWEKGSFIVDYYTRRTNGFNESSLVKGKPFEEVQAKVKEILKDKLVIVCGGGNDFAALHLEMELYDVWDIQTYFQGMTSQVDRFGMPVFQPHKLRSIFKYCFPDECLNNIHTAENDALGTMRIFRWYRNNGTFLHDRRYMEDFTHMPRLK